MCDHRLQFTFKLILPFQKLSQLAVDSQTSLPPLNQPKLPWTFESTWHNTWRPIKGCLCSSLPTQVDLNASESRKLPIKLYAAQNFRRMRRGLQVPLSLLWVSYNLTKPWGQRENYPQWQSKISLCPSNGRIPRYCRLIFSLSDFAFS